MKRRSEMTREIKAQRFSEIVDDIKEIVNGWDSLNFRYVKPSVLTNVAKDNVGMG